MLTYAAHCAMHAPGSGGGVPARTLLSGAAGTPLLFSRHLKFANRAFVSTEEEEECEEGASGAEGGGVEGGGDQRASATAASRGKIVCSILEPSIVDICV